MKPIHRNSLFAAIAATVVSAGVLFPATDAEAASFNGQSELTFDTSNANGEFDQFSSRGVYLGQSPAPKYTIQDVTQSLYGNYSANVNENDIFELGEITHWNGRTVVNTTPNNLDYVVNYNFNDPNAQDTAFTFNVNYADGASNNADSYFIDGVLTSNETVTINGKTYALQLVGFGDDLNDINLSIDTGGLYSNTYWGVYGRFVEAPVSIPTPVAASLGLVSLASLAFRRKRKS